MTDLPRGWTLYAFPAQGAQAKIILPGISGVSHVLTHLSAKMYNSTSSATPFGAVVSVQDGATVIWSSVLFTSSASAGVIPMDSIDTDLNIICSPGNGLTVLFSIAQPPLQEVLSINGYDL